MDKLETTTISDTRVVTNATRLPAYSLSPEELGIEVGLVLGLAILCCAAFLLYLYLARGPEDIPPVYFMKNRLPLIKEVMKVDRKIKKLKKKEEEVYLQ